MAKRASQLLLLEDVLDLGRTGDLVTVRAGHARNFLLPKRKAVVADRNAVRIQEKLQEERAKKAAEDRKDSEVLAGRLTGTVLETHVKVDPEGHMYGSVSTTDITNLLEEKGFIVDKRMIVLEHPVKVTGVHEITLRLTEGVPSNITLKVIPEGGTLEEITPPDVEQMEVVKEKKGAAAAAASS